MRLIDADALPRLTQIYEFNGKRMEMEIVDAKFIDNAPTIDVAPVRHGRWEVVDAEEPRKYGCTICRRLSWYMDNYCPNCGAKMDEGEKI